MLCSESTLYTVTLNPALDRELTVPVLQWDTVLRAESSRVDWGGKGFNVSRALQALGGRSVALGLVGGHAGEQIRAGLEALGIATDFTPIAGETRTNLSVVERAGARYFKVNEPGPAIAPAEWAAFCARVRALARPGDGWVFSGSLPPGIAFGAYAELVTLVQSAGGWALLDTSGPPLRAACAAGPFLIKPNAAEAEELTGIRVNSPADAAEAVRAMHALGAVRVLLTLGREGALLSDGERQWRAVPPAIAERNPIGAGDSSLAGLLWGLSRGLALPEALRWAVACGAAAAGLGGTGVGSLARVEELAAQVRIL